MHTVFKCQIGGDMHRLILRDDSELPYLERLGKDALDNEVWMPVGFQLSMQSTKDLIIAAVMAFLVAALKAATADREGTVEVKVSGFYGGAGGPPPEKAIAGGTTKELPPPVPEPEHPR